MKCTAGNCGAYLPVAKCQISFHEFSEFISRCCIATSFHAQSAFHYSTSLVEMMGLIGMGNNTMVGATVAVDAVSK